MNNDAARANPPRRIADRYEVGRRVGSGGYGAVYRATDTVVGREVAIKLFDADADVGVNGAWREAAVLRRLNLPGVVRLLDEGREGDRHYLVMPFVDGEHFPGPKRDRRADYADVIAAFVELLALVHAAGIVHGDLKPQNVLVDADGQVTLLDFGTGTWVDGLSRERHLDRARGTPAYMAPEQLRGRPATVQSDYYALGAMLYQVFTGQLPHPFASVEVLVRERLKNPAPKLDAEAVGIPARLARAIEGLLSPSAERRGEYVARLLEALDVDHAAEVAPGRLAYVDPHDVVGRVVDGLERGESVDIAGKSGLGRTRCLQEVTSKLRERGRRVTSLIAAESPFDSLRPLVGRVDVFGSLGEVEQFHRRRVAEALDDHKVLVADNFEQLDAQTRRLLAQERHRGGVVCAHHEPVDGALELQPLSEEELQAFFDGPEMIFHLRSEAARELWKRTEGVPRAAVRRIHLWVRHGLAHFSGDKVIVPPQQLERLRRGLRLEAAVADGADERRAIELPDEPGAPGRLLELLRSGTAEEVVAEARAAARYYDRRGETGLAIAALSEAQSVCRRLDGPNAIYELLADWAKVALASEETPRIEELLYAIERAGTGSAPRLKRLRELVELARRACQRPDCDVLRSLSALSPFEDWELELRRQMYRVRIGVRTSPEVLEEVLADIAPWSQRDGVGREARGSFIGWQGMLAYQRGAFGKASELYLQASRIKQRPTGKLASIISAVVAMMDGLQYRDALEHAQAALRRAERLHQYLDQAFCHYLIRSLRYRLGMELEPADELNHALEMLGDAELVAVSKMTDAAHAFRQTHARKAAALARQAAEAFDRVGNRRARSLMVALAIRCEEEDDADEAAQLADFARACPAKRIGAQILGLLLGSNTPADPSWASALVDLVDRLPTEHRHERLEVISLDEALAAAQAQGFQRS